MVLSIISALLSAVGLFLSAWIVLTAPTFSLLPLSVGAPELAPWLLVGNGVALILAAFQRIPPVRLLAGSVALVGMGLSCVPLVQIPSLVREIDTAFEQHLGVEAEAIAQTSPQALRQQPFSAIDAFSGIPPSSVKHETGIQFASPNGIPLTMEVYRPPDDGVYPAIVSIYGGAWQRGSASENARSNQYLAARGFVVFAISYRHAPQFQFPAQLEDVKSAMQWIDERAKEYGADRDRVCVIGRSAGAHLAMLLGYSGDFPGIKAVVNLYGPVDLVQGYREPPVPDPIDTRTTLRSFLGGPPESFPELYRQASPSALVRGNLPATLLIYGQRDNVVEVKYGRELAARLQAYENRSLLIEIPWADHAFDTIFNGVSSQVSLYYIERFLTWVLKTETIGRN